MTIETTWRGFFTSPEVSRLHGEAFCDRHSGDVDWRHLVERHSLGWVTARATVPVETGLVGFVNVVWDGRTHAWIQDLMVAHAVRHQGIGRQVVRVATDKAAAVGCKWLHVDFADDLRSFYFDACGFAPTAAGLRRL